VLEEKIYALIPWVLSLTTAAALALAWYAWRRRQERRGADWLAFTLFCAALWTACDLFNFLADLPVLESNLKRATWYLILAAGFGFFRFACVHARREHWWEAAQLPVGIALSVNLLLMATNAAHGLIWPGEHWLAFGSARVPWLESGPAFFWVFRPTAYGLPLAGVAALVASAAGSPRFYLRQVIALTAGALVPVLANGVFVSTSVPGLDVTPVAVVPCGPCRRCSPCGPCRRCRRCSPRSSAQNSASQSSEQRHLAFGLFQAPTQRLAADEAARGRVAFGGVGADSAAADRALGARDAGCRFGKGNHSKCVRTPSV